MILSCTYFQQPLNQEVIPRLTAGPFGLVIGWQVDVLRLSSLPPDPAAHNKPLKLKLQYEKVDGLHPSSWLSVRSNKGGGERGTFFFCLFINDKSPNRDHVGRQTDGRYLRKEAEAVAPTSDAAERQQEI